MLGEQFSHFTPTAGAGTCGIWEHRVRARQKGDSKREKPDPERRFSLIFGSLCKSRDLGGAALRRKPQETADFRRKPQKTADVCRNRFLPFAVSLLARSYREEAQRLLHETIRLAEARLMRHAPGGSMPS